MKPMNIHKSTQSHSVARSTVETTDPPWKLRQSTWRRHVAYVLGDSIFVRNKAEIKKVTLGFCQHDICCLGYATCQT